MPQTLWGGESDWSLHQAMLNTEQDYVDAPCQTLRFAEAQGVRASWRAQSSAQQARQAVADVQGAPVSCTTVLYCMDLPGDGVWQNLDAQA
jgi:hypothetical protein